jgi:hypothetical protein
LKRIAEVARLLVLAVLVAVFTASPARAEFPAGTFTMQAENDRIANTDRHYTHGNAPDLGLRQGQRRPAMG